MDNLEDLLKSLEDSLPEGNKEEYQAWLQQGEMKAEDARELYEFCKWVTKHDAFFAEVSSHDMVAADEQIERRFSPNGGLTVEHWPYLKALWATRGDLTDADRDEIVQAILENELRKRGRSIVAAISAVDEKATKTDAAGVALWFVVENQGFRKVADELDERAEEIGEELKAQQKKWKGTSSKSPYVLRCVVRHWLCRFPGDNGGELTPVPDVAGLKEQHDLILEHGRKFTIADLLPWFVDTSTHMDGELSRREFCKCQRQIKKWREQACAAEEEGAFAKAKELRELADNKEQWLKEKGVQTDEKKRKARDLINLNMRRAREGLRAVGLHHLADHLEKHCVPPYGELWCYAPDAIPPWEL